MDTLRGMNVDAVTPRTVLVVCPHAEIAQRLRRRVVEAFRSAAVDVVRDFGGAQQRLAAASYDVVVFDCDDEGDGLEGLVALRRTYPEAPVVAVTAAGAAQALEALRLGAHDVVLTRDVDVPELRTAIIYAVQHRATDHEAGRTARLAQSLLDAIDSPTCAVNPDGVIDAVNQAWLDFMIGNGGDAPHCSVGVNYFGVCAAASATGAHGVDGVAEGLRAVLDGERRRFEMDYDCHSATERRWYSLRVSPLADGRGAVLTHINVTALLEAREQALHLALHDPLTDLPNRALLYDRLLQALAAAKRTQQQISLMFVDVDRFKMVNDSLGHAAGDEVLRAVARRLAATTRGEDSVARFSGDEFVVLLRGANAEQARTHAHRVMDELSQPIKAAGATVQISVSVGLASGGGHTAPDDLLLQADAAMYAAKRTGRGRVERYSESLRTRAAERLGVESELRHALPDGEFVLHYQPLINAGQASVYGVEALLRWDHPTRGLLLPSAFLAITEDTGSIVEIGRWVLRRACLDAALLPDDVSVAVNISGRQLGHPATVPAIREALVESGLDPRRLVAELTETAIAHDADAAIVAMRQLVNLGVRVAIDDFGTGFSSLTYLKRYPVDTIKVDRSFISNMLADSRDAAIVAGVVRLGMSMGLRVVAEGVESGEQHNALASLSCEYAQGFYYGRPVPLPILRGFISAALRHGTQGNTSDDVRSLLAAGGSVDAVASMLNHRGRLSSGTLGWDGESVAAARDR